MEANLESDIEKIARKNIYIITNKDEIEKYLNFALNMRLECGNLKKGNQKPKKDMGILYKRFIIYSKEQVIPIALQKQQNSECIKRKTELLQTAINDSEKEYQEILTDLKLYGITGKPNPITGIQDSNKNQFKTTYQLAFNSQNIGTSNNYAYPSLDSNSRNFNSNLQANTMPLYAGGAQTQNKYPYLDLSLQSNQNQTNQFERSQTQNYYQNQTSSYPDLLSHSQSTLPYSYSQSQPQQMPIVYSPMIERSNSSLSNNVSQTSLNALRVVYCPLEIIQEFVKYANSNTKNKIETCAILAGNENNDSFVIDTLIIPQQAGHVDTCYMTDEIGMFEAQLRYSVMTIGWIHTHPQYVRLQNIVYLIQSLFLSSVDLHNQLGYQLQLPEAVAIVYSPIEREMFKSFRIKDSRMSEISNCKLKGFHEHLDSLGLPAFEQCKHLQYINAANNGINIRVIDLRK